MEIQNRKPCEDLSTSISPPELNADCLMHIFSFLPIMDRIRVQRVCKRWWEVGNLPWRDMKMLDFYWPNWTSNHHHYRRFSSCVKNPVIVTNTILRQVLQLCGGFLRKISLTHLSIDSPDTDIAVVVDEAFVALLKKYCPNMQILSLGTLPNRHEILSYFVKYFNSIIKLNLDLNDYDLSEDKDLESFFHCNRNLRSVTIQLVVLEGRCLRYLPFENIEELIIIVCTIEDSNFHTAIKQLPKLKTFEFFGNICRNFNDLFDSIIMKSNLKTLRIAHYQTENLNLKTITHLRHLEMLDLSDNMLHDDLLRCVSRNCKRLTNVILSNSAEITDASLILVLGLPNLQYVSLSKMSSITNNSLLTKMPKLKSLKCSRIDLLENSCFRNVLESSRNIEYLQVLRCPKVSKETLIADAMRITDNRKSSTRLKIYVDGYKKFTLFC